MSIVDWEVRLEQFVGRVDRAKVVSRVAERARREPVEIARALDIYLNEVSVGIRLVNSFLRPGMRVLEVGSGIGVLSAFLAVSGVDIVSLEPSAQGFDLMRAFRSELADFWHDVSVPELAIRGEELSPEAHGQFDLVFSLNVLEHVDDLGGVLQAIHSVLAPSGRSVHMTPNYTVPYEPHFGLPLVPIWPAYTARILPERVVSSDVWKSLNFVTGRRVRRIGRTLGFHVELVPSIMHDTVGRMMVDVGLRDRHGLVARLVSVAWNAPGIGKIVRELLRRWPAELASPMVFVTSSR
jgi:2-polyprenyl-3-methyl-5-hydroxy-6-metoxy-1,4-benzoquinol methylase